MISNKLVAIFFTELSKLVVLAFKFSSESSKCLLSIFFNLVTLFTRDTRSKWELGQVSADADSGALYHLCIFGIKWRAH